MDKSKAILILNEMPKRCDDCWLANFQREDCYCYCMALQKPIDYDNGFKEMDTKNGDWRWDKCPLKELPDIYELPDWITEEDIDNFSDDTEQQVAYFMGYYDGSCEYREEILGQED